jgi:transcriptional regulator with XRE-family HTH domain
MQTKKQQSVVFSESLRAAMKQKGLRQHHLVNELRVTQAAVSRWYNGSIPSPHLLAQLAVFLGVSVDNLLGKQQSVVLSTATSSPRAITAKQKSGIINSAPIKKVEISDLSDSAREIRAAMEGITKAMLALEKQLRRLGE